jgi:hypothetical protein
MKDPVTAEADLRLKFDSLGMNPMNDRIVLDEPCQAAESEREDNRLWRSGCREDCREHGEQVHLPRSPLPSTGALLFLEWTQFPQCA